MNGSPLTLTSDERLFLTGLLEIALREKLVEEHRSRKPTYRYAQIPLIGRRAYPFRKC